jgi:hypothetical protein
MHKKGKISGLEFWSSGVECINLKNNHLLEGENYYGNPCKMWIFT